MSKGYWTNVTFFLNVFLFIFFTDTKSEMEKKKCLLEYLEMDGQI